MSYESSLESVALLPEQIKQAYTESLKIQYPKRYQKLSRILLVGMGGSALGAHVVETLFAKESKKPFYTVRNYVLPEWSKKDTLIILSSYSGGTEEVLTAARSLKKTDNVYVICAGGALAQHAKRKGWPMYQFDPKFNPSKQPRQGVGYAFGALIGLMHAIGAIDLSEKRLSEALRIFPSAQKRYGNLALSSNPLNLVLKQAEKKALLFVGSEFLVGNMHIVSNQVNETAKHFATYYELPELNHHLMEGLMFPACAKDLSFVFFESDLYYKRTVMRYAITQKVLDRIGIQYTSITLRGKTALAQVFETLLIGSYVSVFLAQQHEVDPTAIPQVDYFKAQLAKKE